MNLTFYSANSKLTGGMLIVSADFSGDEERKRDPCVFLQFKKQIANNPTRKGNYEEGKGIYFKVDQNEMGGVIRAVRTDSDANMFHDYANIKTSLDVKRWHTEASGQSAARHGFLFVLRQGDKKIQVNLGLGCAELLSCWFQWALRRMFDVQATKNRQWREANPKPQDGSLGQQETAKPANTQQHKTPLISKSANPLDEAWPDEAPPDSQTSPSGEEAFF